MTCGIQEKRNATDRGVPRFDCRRCVQGGQFVQGGLLGWLVAMALTMLAVAPAAGQPVAGLMRELEARPELVFPRSREISCKVRDFKPRLDLEFRLHTGYWVEIPFRQLNGPATIWKVTLMVEPVSPESAKPMISEQFIETGPIPEHAKGTIEISGSFAAGEGEYRASWHFADLQGRYCSVAWDVTAKRSRGDRKVPLALAPGEVKTARMYLFRPEDPVDRSASGQALRLKVFLNLDTGSRQRATVRPWRIAPMLAVMRNLFRRPEFVEFALVAYSQEDQKVLHREDYGEDFDFQALGLAIRDLAPATVEFSDLRKDSETGFVEQLLAAELDSDDKADAIVFIGYEHWEGKKISKQSVQQMRREVPVFYFNFARHAWTTTLGSVVKAWGGSQLRVRGPRDLVKAIDKVVEQSLTAVREAAGG
ncbi:MAG: hypothetical protein O2968_21815 [Acidobacteria bacterium]|nr:hypothetical protein [Acidobacteriota bacterium]